MTTTEHHKKETSNSKSYSEQHTPKEKEKEKIKKVAYFKAKDRGFKPGYEMEDWLAAEQEIKQKTQRQ